MRVFTSKSDRGHPKDELCQIPISIRPNYAPKRLKERYNILQHAYVTSLIRDLIRL